MYKTSWVGKRAWHAHRVKMRSKRGSVITKGECLYVGMERCKAKVMQDLQAK